MLEMGSQYSSDFEEVEKSVYLTTDGEDNEEAIRAQQRQSNVRIMRGDYLDDINDDIKY